MKKFINKNTLCSLFYGFFGSLGFLCMANVYFTIDYNPSEHPYSAGFSVIAGVFSLFACIMIFVLNVMWYCKAENKLKLFFAELAVTIVSFIVFLAMWCFLWDLTSDFIKYNGW